MKNLIYPNSTRARKVVIALDPSENYEGGAPVMVRILLNGREADSCTWNIIDAGFEPETESFTAEEWKWLHSMNATVKNFFDSLEVK